MNTGLGRSPGGGHGNPLQYTGLENPHGQRSLVGHSPRDGKEADMTERLSMPVSGFGKTAQTLVCAGLMSALVCSKRK